MEFKESTKSDNKQFQGSNVIQQTIDPTINTLNFTLTKQFPISRFL